MPDAPCTHPAHHWLIPRAEGPTSLGVCKFCGAEREFNNGHAWKEYRQEDGAARMPQITLQGYHILGVFED